MIVDFLIQFPPPAAAAAVVVVDYGATNYLSSSKRYTHVCIVYAHGLNHLFRQPVDGAGEQMYPLCAPPGPPLAF